MIVTRFNPSLSGSLHLGHIVTAIVNERFAHRNNGKFIVRFDDTSPVPASLPSEQRIRMMEMQQEDIKWMELPVDEWCMQSEQIPKTKTILNLKRKYVPDILEVTLPLFVSKMGSGWLPYPYVPEQIAERVVMDNMIDTTHVIRGEEFATEYSLYSYYCQTFEFPTPTFVFIPRLYGISGDISKTNGGYKISEMRGIGYSPKQIKDMLAKACLINPYDDWEWHNMKCSPKINL